MPITGSFQNIASRLFNIETWPQCPSLEAFKILFQWCIILKLDLITHGLKRSKFYFDDGEYWHLTSLPKARSNQNLISMMLNIQTWPHYPWLSKSYSLHCPSLLIIELLFQLLWMSKLYLTMSQCQEVQT